ncbi:MAG: hypothetical protein IT320_07350 [Anaerolineae bacterium]|nr:hypothetical protein [Anaerolineae bacterium]
MPGQRLVVIRRTLLVSALLALALAGTWASVRQTPSPPLLETCTDIERAAALAALPPYEPASSDEFVRIRDGQLVAGDQPVAVRGFNYYPSHYPWRRFLTETDVDALDGEFTLMQSVGANTLRIFVWNEALFQCPGSGAVPVADAFERLDRFIRAADERDLRLIVTLNDLADLEDYPLYADPEHVAHKQPSWSSAIVPNQPSSPGMCATRATSTTDRIRRSGSTSSRASRCSAGWRWRPSVYVLSIRIT